MIKKKMKYDFKQQDDTRKNPKMHQNALQIKKKVTKERNENNQMSSTSGIFGEN